MTDLESSPIVIDVLAAAVRAWLARCQEVSTDVELLDIDMKTVGVRARRRIPEG